MSQMSLLAPSDYSARVRAVLSEIVHEVGGFDAAAKICKTTKQLLSEGLSDDGAAKSKFVRTEWIGALLNAASRHLGLKLRRALVGEGYDVKERDMSPAEELARLKEVVRRRFGPSGDDSIEEARGA